MAHRRCSLTVQPCNVRTFLGIEHLFGKQTLDQNLLESKILVVGVLDEPLEIGVIRFQPVRPRIGAEQATLLFEVVPPPGQARPVRIFVGDSAVGTEIALFLELY